MTNKGNRWMLLLCLLLSLTLAGGAAAPVFAEEESERPSDEAEEEEQEHMPAWSEPAQTDSLTKWPAAPQIEGKSAVVIDLEYGAVLYSKNADEKLYPASITKVMTGFLACENLNPEDKFVMTEANAFGIESGSSSIYASPGEEFTVEQGMMALMLESANEIALQLGEEVSGSVKKFVELMNEKARELGCTNTHFNNPNGLPDERHYTTAHDMALIAKAAWKNRLFRKYVCTGYFTIEPTNIREEALPMMNHHRMMKGQSRAYDGVLGGKTGYTEAAGNTLVTYAKRGNMRLAVVVMGSVDGAYSDTAALLDYAFGNFHKMNMNVPEDRDSVEGRLLPCEKYLIRNQGDLRPFYYKSRMYVIVPSNVGREKIEPVWTLNPNYAGLPYLDCVYMYEGNPIGTARVYMRRSFLDPLTDPSEVSSGASS